MVRWVLTEFAEKARHWHEGKKYQASRSWPEFETPSPDVLRILIAEGYLMRLNLIHRNKCRGHSTEADRSRTAALVGALLQYEIGG